MAPRPFYLFLSLKCNATFETTPPHSPPASSHFYWIDGRPSSCRLPLCAADFPQRSTENNAGCKTCRLPIPSPVVLFVSIVTSQNATATQSGKISLWSHSHIWIVSCLLKSFTCLCVDKSFDVCVDMLSLMSAWMTRALGKYLVVENLSISWEKVDINGNIHHSDEFLSYST